MFDYYLMLKPFQNDFNFFLFAKKIMQTGLCFIFAFLISSCSLSGSIKSISQKDEAPASPVVSPVTGSDELRLTEPTDYIKPTNQTAYPLAGSCKTTGTLAIEVNNTLIKTGVSCENETFSTTLDLSSITSGDVSVKVYSEVNTAIESTVTIMKDTVGPTLFGVLSDGSVLVSLVESPTLSWSSATDEHSGLERYQIALGITSGGSEIINWIDIGNVTSYQFTGLNLSRAVVYYPSVRAIDYAGNVSATLTGDGWTPDTSINAISNLSLDEAHNSTVASPDVTFDYSTTGNTLSLDSIEYSVGTSVGATDVLTWTSHTIAQTLAVSGLSLSINTNYYINIRAKDTSGKTSSVVSGQWRSVGSVTVAARYASAPNWNSYVRKSATTTACDGSESGTYYACLHGGEKKSVSITGENSCTDLEVYDSQDAFRWHCKAGTPVSFVTYELKDGRGLKDLINTDSWKSLRVIVKKSGVAIAASTKTTWWSNTVQQLPDNSTNSTIEILNENAIYTLSTSRSTAGYELGNGAGVVMLNNSVLSGTEVLFGDDFMDIGIQYDFFRNWIEGRVVGTLGNSGGTNNLNLSVLNNVFHQGVFNINAIFNQNKSLLRYYVNYSNLNFFNQAGNVLRNSVFYGRYSAPNVTGSLNIFFQNYFYDEFGVIGGTVGTLPNKVSFNTFFEMFNIIFSNRTSLHKNLSPSFVTLRFGTNTTLTLSDNIFNSLDLWSSNTTNAKFTGLMGYNTCDGSSVSTTTGINSSCVLSAPSNATQVSGLDILNSTTSSFVGVVISDSNHPGYDGTPISFTSISNLLEFDRPSRRWANAASLQQPCTTGQSCVIYDYALKSTDIWILNKSGDLATANDAFPTVATDTCPSEVHGNVVVSNQSSTPETYLRNAFEIIGDEIGDDDSLCETNEECVYTPNVGAYQGHGDFYTRSCAFQNGTVTGVIMYSYPNNGY